MAKACYPNSTSQNYLLMSQFIGHPFNLYSLSLKLLQLLCYLDPLSMLIRCHLNYSYSSSPIGSGEVHLEVDFKAFFFLPQM